MWIFLALVLYCDGCVIVHPPVKKCKRLWKVKERWRKVERRRGEGE